MSKQVTPEQKAAAAEKRERFRQMVKDLAELSDEQRAALTVHVGRVINPEGRALSVANTLLVITQKPSASMVGGFHQWRKLGRKVKKGASGLMIWVPIARRDREGTEGSVEGEEKSRGQGFMMGYVFDISDTEPIVVE